MTRTLTGFLVVGALLLVGGLANLAAQGDDVDILGLASSLTSKSAELQQAQDQLATKREEVKREAEAVKKEEKKVEDLKAAATGGPVTVTVRGDRIIQKDGEVFLHFINRRSRKFGSYEEAVAQMKRFDLTPDYTGVTITDATGKTLTKAPPRPDNAVLDTATKALADRQAAVDRATQKYLADKAAYDRDLVAYNASLDKLNKALPNAIRDAGSPVPTADQLTAPKSEFQVQDLGQLATKYKGKTAKDGKATAFVQEAAGVPEAAKWVKGDKVEGAKLRPGTPIATFNPQGAFVEGKGSHSAIYITQNKKGIWVYDQYKNAKGEQRPVDTRFIRFNNNASSPSNHAGAYSVIHTKGRPIVPDVPPERNP